MMYNTASSSGISDTITRPAMPIPDRDTRCNSSMIDLSCFYTESLDDNIHHKPGNTLSNLPKGILRIEGCDFDIRGIVQLAGLHSKEITTLVYPEHILAIPAKCKGNNIHFLHASAWNIDLEQTLVGAYHIHYENGHTEKIQLSYRQNIWDWWGKPEELNMTAAWRGFNERTKAIGQHIRLFKLSCPNLFPDLRIESLDLISNCKGPGPMVVSITITD